MPYGGPMAVEIEVLGQPLPGAPRRQALLLNGATTAREITARLGLDPAAVGPIMIDGVQRQMSDMVPPNCGLCCFPPASGGG